MTIPSGKARVAGVIGWPIAHSLSPRLHNCWIARYGIDGMYVPLGIRPEDVDYVFCTHLHGDHCERGCGR